KCETFTKNRFSNWKKPKILESMLEVLIELTTCNQGNYLRILRFLANHNKDIKKVTLKNAPRYNILIAPSIQKDIVRACSIETTNTIIKDISDALFAILIDKSCDASMKEQVVVVLQYVDRNRFVIERFLGSKHVTSTITISLKEALDQLFSKHGLSISRLRGQGHDRASNMVSCKSRDIFQEKYLKIMTYQV
ncbi:hypothetical protein CISIN_1g040037mg, partial [Citrus sinensis]